MGACLKQREGGREGEDSRPLGRGWNLVCGLLFVVGGEFGKLKKRKSTSWTSLNL